MKTLNVLYQHDNNYAVYGGVSILSLFENNKNAEDIHVFLVDMGLDENFKSGYESIAAKYNRKITFIPAKDIIDQIAELGIPKYRGSYATYMKLFIIKNLPSVVDRIFYLDSDTLVLGDLTPLIDLDMKDCPLGMCIDFASLAFKDAYGFKKDEPYFCGGTMLIDRNRWVDQKCLERITDYAINVRSAFFAADQDIMNRVLKGQIFPLDLRYDFYYHHSIYSNKLIKGKFGNMKYYTDDQIEIARKDIGVLHFMRFLGEDPWHEGNLHPHKNLYLHYLNMSPWKDVAQKKSGKKGVFTIEKFLFRLLPRFVFFHIYMLYYRIYMINADKKLSKQFGGDITF